ncbi:MAG: hypothetical protein M3T55_03610, partial [Pseudomonadota bacterium]|nr:hypothetical protein [Pseudomonadota bacterium]
MAALAALTLALGATARGEATAQASGGGLSCGQSLGGPIFDTWTAMGGAGGPLGCPTAGEMASAASPQGARAR